MLLRKLLLHSAILAFSKVEKSVRSKLRYSLKTFLKGVCGFLSDSIALTEEKQQIINSKKRQSLLLSVVIVHQRPKKAKISEGMGEEGKGNRIFVVRKVVLNKLS